MAALAIGLLISLALQLPLGILAGHLLRRRSAAPTTSVPAVPEEGNR